jgi:hypothetical protein
MTWRQRLRWLVRDVGVNAAALFLITYFPAAIAQLTIFGISMFEGIYHFRWLWLLGCFVAVAFYLTIVRRESS